MSDLILLQPVELTDAELDTVSAGQISVGNLLNINVSNLLNGSLNNNLNNVLNNSLNTSGPEPDQHPERRRRHRRHLA